MSGQILNLVGLNSRVGSTPIRATTMIPTAKQYNLSADLQKVYDVVLDLWQEGEDSVYSATDIVLRCEREYGFKMTQTMKILESLTMREVLRVERRNQSVVGNVASYEKYYGPHSFEQGEP